MFKTTRRHLLLTTAAVAAIGAATPALAQAQQGGEADAPKSVKTVEEVTVVGTHISGVKPVGSEAVVITREDAERTGYANIGDVVRLLPEVQTGVGGDVGMQGGTPNQGYNGGQIDAINLRGLGTAATLVLVDGHRVVGQGAAATATDANQLPLAAIARVEVLPDGASAVYGSDAVAGVVNFVVRKDYDGAEATFRLGNQTGGTEYVESLTAGRSWESVGGLGRGNVIVTFQHQNRDAFNGGDIDRLLYNQSPFGGPDLRINANSAFVGLAPNVVTHPNVANSAIPTAGGYLYYGVPAGSNGVGLNAGTLLLNNPNLVEPAGLQDYTGAQQVNQFALYFHQDLTPNLELYGDAGYTKRTTRSTYYRAAVNVDLFPQSGPTPFFIPGLPGGTPFYVPFAGIIANLGGNEYAQYSTLKDNMAERFLASSETYNFVVGLRGDLGHGWHGDAYYNYGHNQQCDSCYTGLVNSAALQDQVNKGLINPLSTAPLTAQQLALVYGRGQFASRTTLSDFVAKADGALFDLPQGPVKMAFGAEYQTQTNANQNNSTSGVTNAPTTLSTYGSSRISRSIKSVFAELYVPLVSEEMAVPLMKSLRGSAAVRYDSYSGVGDTTNPKFGLTWEINDDFRLEGSWSKSFRAPSITDINPNAVASGSLLTLPNTDPRIVNGISPALGLTNAGLLLGSNPDLSPETSTNYSVSAVYSHDGLNLKLTFWDIKYRNKITFPGVIPAFLAGPANNYGGWGAFVIPIHNPATCNNNDISTADPALQPLLRNLNVDFVGGGGSFGSSSTLRSNFCGINVVLDSRIQNVATVAENGIDVSGTYTTRVGDIGLTGRAAVTVLLKDDLSTNTSQPPTSQLGVLGNSFKWRSTASVTADWRHFDATLTAHYLSSVTANVVGVANQALPPKKLAAFTSFDLAIGYAQKLSTPQFGLQGWRAQLVVTNLFDQYPSYFVHSSGLGNPAWDYSYGQPYGRTYAFQLTAQF